MEFINLKFVQSNDKSYRVCKLHKGDRIYARKFADECNLKIGSKIYGDDSGSLKVIKIDYAPKKWWQFWKKKQIIGYEMEYV